jgi:hypothetical protein
MRAPLLLLPPITLLVCAPPIAAQTRPLRTEQAGTAPAGRLVLETGFDLIANDPSYVTGVKRSAWNGPLLRLVFSPADSVELDVEWVALVGILGDTQPPGVRSTAFGDVALRAKWRLLKGVGRRPTLGVRFGVYLPETPYNDKQFRPLGLGPNAMRSFAEGLITQRMGRGLIHANLGLFLADEVLRPHEQRDLLSYGLALEWPLRPALAALAELAGQAGSGRPGADAHAEARAGLRLTHGRLAWDLAARRGLAGADGTWGATAGVALTLR